MPRVLARWSLIGLLAFALMLFIALIRLDSVSVVQAKSHVAIDLAAGEESPRLTPRDSSLVLAMPYTGRNLGIGWPREQVAQGGVISTITSIINHVINATVYFPARTFQEAVEKATRNIFTGQLDAIRGPLQEVINLYAFTTAAVFGGLGIPPEVQAIGQRLTEAAVPLWVLSLVLMGLAVLTRNAAGLGYGSGDIALEFLKWMFIALASGNGASIVNVAHNGFSALAYAIASTGGTVGAAEFVAVFIPSVTGAQAWPIILLVIGTIIGLITVIVLAVTYIARYTLLLAVTGLAPIAIACEGIPFTRFVFRDWLSTFLRLELLQIINVTMLVIFKALGFIAAARAGSITQVVLLITVMLGLSSALIGINISAFRQVFGTAIDVAGQLRGAGEQLVRAVGVIAGMVSTAGTGGSVLAAAAGLASATSTNNGNSTSSSDNAVDTNSSTSDGMANLGGMVRAWGRATGSPFAQGFGDGAGVGAQMRQRQAASAQLATQQEQAEQRRAEQLAREMGARDGDDIDAIAQSILKPSDGASNEQITRAHRDNAPLLRDMVKEFGSPARAAAIGGQGRYGSFGEMAIAMAHERLNLSENARPTEAPATPIESPSPAQDWVDAPPKLAEVGSDHKHPFDYGIGAALARHTHATPANAPLWAETAYSLRMNYGEDYVRNLVDRTQANQWSERRLMDEIETQLSKQPPIRTVNRFWVADSK